MPSSNSRPQFFLPVLIEMRLRNFSLYPRQENIALKFEKGVFCLAGANGLGKSTFISILNYALTGAVPIPTRQFKSADEYYKLSVDFSPIFFEGRVEEDDRENAEVDLSLRVRDTLFEFTRGFFETEELRQLRIVSNGSVTETSNLPSDERHAVYAEMLAQNIGLGSFQQFVFLQHFVFTFDESRHLLFWDQRALEQALYLAFGLDVESAQRADDLRRGIEKADSRARNLNWQATQTRSKLQDLEDAVAMEADADEKLEGLRDLHKKLTKKKDVADTKVVRIQSSLSDTELAIATASARQATLRLEYQTEYTRYLRGRIEISKHPIVSAILGGGPCQLCGNESDSSAAVIEKKLTTQHCPLCDSALPEKAAKPTARLLSIDKQLAEASKTVDEGVKRRERLTKEYRDAEESSGIVSKELLEFERENTSALKRLGLDGEGSRVDTATTRYKEQIAELLDRKKNELSKRDELKRQLRSLQKALMSKYTEAEEYFAPRFRELAALFLGLDLDIRIETTSGSGLTLILEVKSAVRRAMYQLSESQRFFVDIALRMALLEFMSADTGGALLIDTPEGALDIAYENRAGTMFASFAKKNFTLMMTANINTSQLLIALAEQCGKEFMTLSRMTSWADLSEVQVAQEQLFNSAFDAIQSALSTGSTKKGKNLRA